MKNKILTFSFLIISLFLPLLAQYEWSEPVMLGPKIAWPDAYGYTEIIVDKNGIIHAFWEKVFDRTGDNYTQIFYRYSTDGGVNWSETQNLTPQYTNYGQNIGNLNVVCDSKNNLHLMFLRGTEWSKVMYMKYDGISWIEPVSIYDYAISNLRIAIGNNDRIYAVWYSDPAYYSYFENDIWTDPKSISDTYMPSIHDVIVTNENNVYACGSVGGVNNYRPFVCRYDLSLEDWNDFIQIPGFEENSWASCMTFSKNDTLNVNVGVGPTTQENINYNLRRKIGELSWSSPQYVNENTDMKRKDFFSDNDDKLHLFEKSYDYSSIIYTDFNYGFCNEYIFPCESENSLQLQDAFFDSKDTFYLIYRKNYHETNERAIFFQKKQIEVGIEDSDELTVKDCKLHQNYPNPFNSVSVIEYSIDKPSNIKLSVYNLKGELINTLVNKKQDTGKYSVQLKTDDLGSGVYYYRLEVDGIVKDTKKMLYLR